GSGYTAYSTDGATWKSGGTIIDSTTKSSLGSGSTAMCYGHNIFLVLAGTSIAYSSDGLSWTIRTGVLPSATWRGVTAVGSNKKFVAISSNGKVATTDDPTTGSWQENTTGSTSLSSITSGSWGGLSYGDGKLMAVSYSAIAAYCADDSGSSWQNQSTGLSSIHSGEWYGTFFENSTFYAHTSNVYLAKNELTTNAEVSSIKFTNLNSSSTSAYKNDTNININEETTFTINDSDISNSKEGGKYCIRFDMKMIRLISAEISHQITKHNPTDVEDLGFKNCDTINFKNGETSGEILSYTTTTGQTSYKNGYGLQCSDHTSFSGTFTTSKAGENLYVTVEKNDSKPITNIVSPGLLDLTKWQASDTNLSTSINSGYWETRNIAYGNGKFYAVNYSGYVAYSSDGKTWQSGGTLPSGEWRGMAYGGGKFVAVSWNGYIAYSSDGATWSTVTGPSGSRSSYWYGGIAYGNGKFIITNGDAYVAYSSDGSSWEFIRPLSSIQSYGWDGAATCGKYNNVDRFLAICYYNNIAYSSTGITWSSPGSFSTMGYIGLCYGDDKFVAISSNGSVYCSTDGGAAWTLMGSPLESVSSNSGWSAISYGNNIFVAIASDGYAAYCNAASTPSTTIIPAFKFNGSEISGNTTKNISLNNATSITIPMENIRLVSASMKYQDTVKGHNIIDFSSQTNNTKNGCTLTFSGSTVNTNGFRTVPETNSTGDLQVNTTYGIKSLSITVAPLDGGATSDGKFRLKSETYGRAISDTSEKQVRSKETFYVNPADLTVTKAATQENSDVVTYKISFSMTKIKLISAQVTLDNRIVSKYPNFSWRENSRLVNWSKNPAIKDDNIDITNNYSNYDSESQLHSINSSSCRPNVIPTTYAGDCTFISQEYSTNPFTLNLAMPNKTFYGYYAPGITRIFSESTRGSSNNIEISTSISNSAYLIATEVTYPVNHLLATKYQTQTTENTKTINKDATTALKELTDEAAKNLKSNANTKVYIIKYRCPSKYMTRQLGNSSSAEESYNYSYLDNCATGTSTPYMYTVNSESELETALSNIADDIKSSTNANYQEAKNVN
ncbi:MAG: hypothetical protein LBT67_00625, partial [Holosporaceae bacterium]|nr:hypothetical protein [Holosporaceae bacterium]